MGCTTAPTLGDDCCSAQQSQENTTFRSSQVAFTDEVAAIVEIGPLETLQTRASYSILQNDADISFKANTAIPFLWHYQLLPESRFYASDHDYCAKHHAGTQTGKKTNSTDAQCALSVKALKEVQGVDFNTSIEFNCKTVHKKLDTSVHVIYLMFFLDMQQRLTVEPSHSRLMTKHIIHHLMSHSRGCLISDSAYPTMPWLLPSYRQRAAS
ncbi:hypothetical protein MRX96_010161 [Rhipicephalus microplus]